MIASCSAWHWKEKTWC